MLLIQLKMIGLAHCLPFFSLSSLFGVQNQPEIFFAFRMEGKRCIWCLLSFMFCLQLWITAECTFKMLSVDKMMEDGSMTCLLVLDMHKFSIPSVMILFSPLVSVVHNWQKPDPGLGSCADFFSFLGCIVALGGHPLCNVPSPQAWSAVGRHLASAGWTGAPTRGVRPRFSAEGSAGETALCGAPSFHGEV